MKNPNSSLNSHTVRRSAAWGATFFLLSLLFLSAIRTTPAQNNSSRHSVRLEGDIEVIFEDSHGRGRLRYFLNTAHKKLELRFSNEPPGTLRTGMRVAVSGIQIDNTLELNSGESVSINSTGVPVSGNSMGEHRVLVIMVNFQDKQTQPFTREQAQAVMFGTTNDYYREASYGQTSLSGDVYGWYTIPASFNTCDTAAIANYAQQAAVAAGANLAAYDHIVYAFPQNACTWQGRGTVGGSPSQAWINEWFELGIVGHELGHNFGLYHSRSMDCGSAVVDGNCTIDEYGDVFDLMGAANSAHFNLYQKERLGWLNGAGNAPITTVSASGSYWLDSYEPTTLNSKGLKILKSTDPVTGAKTWYYAELRSAFGFDSFLSSYANVLGGVLIHTGSDSNGADIYLLDMTPATTSWYDPALTVGQRFTDTAAGVTITTVAVNGTSALVDVTFAPQACVRANPTVTLTPSTSPWLSAGAPATFTATLRNNDGNGCQASTFNWQSSIASGWTASGLSTTVLSPGSTATLPLQVTPPAKTADGSYPVTITAVNGSAPAYSAAASATYSLVSALSVTTSTSQSTYTRNQTATVNTTTRAAGAVVSGVTIVFTMVKPNGTTVTSTVTTGSTGLAVFKYAFDRKKDPAGTYQVRAQASLNGVSGSGSVSFPVK